MLTRFVEMCAERLHVERAVGMDRHHTEQHALAVAEQLPGHDVGMMFHHRQDNLVVVFKERAEA